MSSPDSPVSIVPPVPAGPRRPVASLSRRYHLSASHRLHSDQFNEERNREIFGKCNNPFGHGHNYVVEVCFSGPICAQTGMVLDLAELDAFAQEMVLARFDHQNLNTLPCFRATVSSTENLTVELQRIFRHFPGVHLEHVRVEETPKNSFLYCGPEPCFNPLRTTEKLSSHSSGSHSNDVVFETGSHSGTV